MQVGRLQVLSALKVTIWFLSIINLIFFFIFKRTWEESKNTQHEDKISYSWIGDDIPPTLPLSAPLPIIEATIEESERFKISEETLPTWWANLATDLGYVRLGPEHRIFAISTHHAQHCLYAFARVLSQPKPRKVDGHIHHCMNYVRQSILCAADTTLEPPDWQTKNFEVERTSGGWTRECRDWTALRAYVKENYDEWRVEKVASSGGRNDTAVEDNIHIHSSVGPSPSFLL